MWPKQILSLRKQFTWRYILKTSQRHLCNTSWRCLEDVLKTPSERLEDVLKMSWRRFEKGLEDVLKTPWIFLERHLEDVLKASWRRLQNVLKLSWRLFCKTSWGRLENILKTTWQEVLKTSWRRLEDVWSRLIYWCWSRRLKDDLKTSSEGEWLRWIYSSWSRRLEDVLKASSENEDERLLQDVSKTSSSRQMFAGTKAILICLVGCFGSCSAWEMGKMVYLGESFALGTRGRVKLYRLTLSNKIF